MRDNDKYQNRGNEEETIWDGGANTTIALPKEPNNNSMGAKD